MKRPMAVVAVMALFLVGIVIGILATHMFYARQLRRPGGPPMVASRFYAGMLERNLELSPEQRSEIDGILERSHERAQELRHEMGPRVRSLMESTTEEIEAVLSPEQQEDFERMRERHRRPLEHLFLGPGGRGRHRGPPGRPPAPEDGP